MAQDRADEHERWRAWMRRAQEGDADAYRRLLGELYGFVEAYARRIIGDSPLLEDCVQECLTAVHRARHSYDPSRPFRPWLTTIVRHKAIDSLRRDRSASQVQDDGLAESPRSRDEAAMDARRLLARLEEPYRGALVLTKLRGHSMAEAAEIEGVGLSAMKTRVHRGLRKLAVLLESEP